MPDDPNYYRQSRSEMLRFVPPSTRRLMDIGCGEGRFGEAVKRMLPECETWGVEPVPAAAAEAAKRNDTVVNRHLDDVGDLPPSHFDVVSLNDVLEHLPYPEPALAIAKRILKPGGTLLLSLPNVRYYLNVRDLLFRKDWEYQDFGILDRTHFRFFTQKSALRLLSANGFDVRHVEGINAEPLKLHYRMLFATRPAFFKDMRFPQFAVVARPS